MSVAVFRSWFQNAERGKGPAFSLAQAFHAWVERTTNPVFPLFLLAAFRRRDFSIPPRFCATIGYGPVNGA